MPTIGDVRRWAPSGLTFVADLLVTRGTTLVGLQDELDTTVQPDGWVGQAADAAYTRRGVISENFRRLVAQVHAVRSGVDDAAASVTTVQAALLEAETLAAAYSIAIGDDGAVRDTAPGGMVLDETAAADRARMFTELQGRAGQVLRTATEVDTDLAGVLRADAQRHDILTRHPELVGNLDGIPATVRDGANRAQLPAQLAAAQAELDRAQAAYDDRGLGTRLGELVVGEGATGLDEDLQRARDKYADLEKLTGIVQDPERQLLLVDTSGEMVKAAVANGDVDTADHVAVSVPGFTTTVHGSLEDMSSAGSDLRAQTEDRLYRAERGDQSVATISWIGYEAPQWGGFLDDLNPFDTVVSNDKAQEGGHALSSFLNGVDTSRVDDPHLTTLGHSYGSAPTGFALQDGTGVDDAVFYGPPGLGTSNVPALGTADGHVYVEEADWDPVADLATFGDDPNQLNGVTGLSTHQGTSPDGIERDGVTLHTSYTNDQTMPQYNMAVVAAGMPELAVHVDGRGLGDIGLDTDK